MGITDYKKNKNTLIIWDWDNTLMDTSTAILSTLKDTMAHYHLRAPTQEDLNAVLGHAPKEYWQDLFPEKLDEAFDFAMKRFAIYHIESQLFPQATEILHTLHNACIPQLIISNKPKILLDKEIEKAGVKGDIEGVVGTLNLTERKPQPDYGAKEIAQIKHDRRIVIGDSPSDMAYAAAIGGIGVYLKGDNKACSNVLCDYCFSTLNYVFIFLKNQFKIK